MRRTLTVIVGVVALLLLSAPPASAYAPVNIVHTETVHAGAYDLTVGFGTWPIRAMQSLDFTFTPDGGIAGRSGTITLSGTEGQYSEPLSRHPRKREVWGLDVQSIPAPGDWILRFDLAGPAGGGTGELPLTVLEQPGPPLALSWSISTFPLLGLIALFVVASRRSTKP